MGNIEAIFVNGGFWLTTLSLVGLFGSCLYSDLYIRKVGADKEVGKGLLGLFYAIMLEYIISLLNYRMSVAEISAFTGEMSVFTELLGLVIVMLWLIVSSSRIASTPLPEKAVLYGIGLVCVLFNGVIIFIMNNGNIAYKLTQIYPLIGFVYIAVSLWLRTKQPQNFGYLPMSLLCSAVALFLLFRILGISDAVYTMWSANILIYVVLSMGVLTVCATEIYKKMRIAEQDVEQSKERLEQIIRTSPFPIIISRVQDDKILLANNNALKLLGIEGQNIEEYKLKDFFADSENRAQLNSRIEKEKEVKDFEILCKTPSNDTPFWLLASANIIDYKYDIAIYMALQDITTRKKRENILQDQAIRDPLTSLYNRRYFEDAVGKAILQAKKKEEAYSVLMVDADHFKKVNDTFGHKTGDKVLIELAATCEKALRDCDIVSRYGGEEFTIFLKGIDAQKAFLVADRLRESLAQVVVYSDDGQQVKFTVSIGVSSSEISDNTDMLVKTADEALYRAKENGRNRVEVFHKADLEQFSLQAEEKRENSKHNYHPIFDKEPPEEISLLDGVANERVLTDNKH